MTERTMKEKMADALIGLSTGHHQSRLICVERIIKILMNPDEGSLEAARAVLYNHGPTAYLAGQPEYFIPTDEDSGCWEALLEPLQAMLTHINQQKIG